MHEDVRRLRKSFDATKADMRDAATCCDRCGLTRAQLATHSRQLELHHIRSISSYVRAGITDHEVVNSKKNIQVLCTFCHVFWHKIAEPIGCSYRDFFEARPAHLDII